MSHPTRILPAGQTAIERRSALIWTTAEGRNLPIEDMDTKHLFNSMKMCFNHLAQMWGGQPIWFVRHYSDFTNAAVSGPDRLARNVALMLIEIDRRRDLPAHYAEPLAHIKAQIASKTQALPQPAEAQNDV